jgi:hypothetical protein
MKSTRRILYLVGCGVFIALPFSARPLLARQTSADQAPVTSVQPGASSQDNTDGSQPGPEPSNPQPPPKDDRIFGVMPNFVTVEGGAQAPPLTAKGKFKLTAEGAFDPYEFVITGIIAGLGQADRADESLGQGLKGYAKRYGVDFANQVGGNFMTGAVFPSLLRQDPRYYELSKGGFLRRFGYAVSRVAVIRSDQGANQFNYSEVLGNAAAAGLSNLYSPREDRHVSSWVGDWAEQISIDAFGNELKEFWPDIRRKLFSGKKKDKSPATASVS